MAASGLEALALKPVKMDSAPSAAMPAANAHCAGVRDFSNTGADARIRLKIPPAKAIMAALSMLGPLMMLMNADVHFKLRCQVGVAPLPFG